jgi:membrane associated rhomboid family serine protease
MGLADRDYQREIPSGGTSFASGLTPVVKWLLILNIGIFVFDFFNHWKLTNEGAFAVRSALFEFRIWEFITFQFLHYSPGHILCNALGLFFFGPWVERWWGSAKFLAFYLICGVGGAAFFTLLCFAGVFEDGLISHLIGASAGIYGILIAVAVIAPDMKVMLLFPPIELTMKKLAIAVLAIAAVAVVFNLGGNSGGEAGHLGGAIAGFLLMKFPWLLGGQPGVETIRPKASRKRYESKLRPRSSNKVSEDDEVDKILDKVSREGIQSLTKAERETLENASKRHR